MSKNKQYPSQPFKNGLQINKTNVNTCIITPKQAYPVLYLQAFVK